MQHVTPRALAAWLDDARRDPPLVVDVREPWEWAICHIEGSVLLPMRELLEDPSKLDPEAPTVLVCHHGVRSFRVARVLESRGFSALYNLTGGLAAWAREIDPAMPTY